MADGVVAAAVATAWGALVALAVGGLAFAVRAGAESSRARLSELALPAALAASLGAMLLLGAMVALD